MDRLSFRYWKCLDDKHELVLLEFQASTHGKRATLHPRCWKNNNATKRRHLGSIVFSTLAPRTIESRKQRCGYSASYNGRYPMDGLSFVNHLLVTASRSPTIETSSSFKMNTGTRSVLWPKFHFSFFEKS